MRFVLLPVVSACYRPILPASIFVLKTQEMPSIACSAHGELERSLRATTRALGHFTQQELKKQDRCLSFEPREGPG